jgi:hypothetical protein
MNVALRTPTMSRGQFLDWAAARDGADDPWTATTLIADDTLQMPEIGVEIPVVDFYEGTDIPSVAQDTADGD